MKSRYFLILLFLIGIASYAYSQVVIGDDALSSRTYRSSSSWSSVITAPGATGVHSSSSAIVGGGSNWQMPVRTYSPSGSTYSSSVASPFSNFGPTQLRRSDDDDDLPGEPGENPGDPGDPMPIGEGLWLMILASALYGIKRNNNKE